MFCKVDDALRHRAQAKEQIPLVAYPKSRQGLTDFELFSAQDVDRLTSNAVRELLRSRLKTAHGGTVALLGLSTFDYLINMLAISRMRYTVLMLSPRLSIDAYVSLLEKCSCNLVAYAPEHSPLVERIRGTHNITAFEILSRSLYDCLESEAGDTTYYDESRVTSQVAYIMYSSGSTGYPKPVFQTHQACIENFSRGHGLRAFSTVPLYHTNGHASFFRTLFNGGTLYLFNINLPLTSQTLILSLEKIQPEIMFGVPYVLKLLAESPKGIAALKAINVVSSAGSAIPDEIGDLLVEKGVNLVTLYGSTETGQLMNSNRPKGDTAWSYMRLIPSVKPFIKMTPVSADTYELIVLDGLKSKVVSNADNPPNSFYSRDLFTPHASIPDAWKYIGRLDDRITLVNGEKVLPIPIEGRIRQDPSVKEAVVFGIGKDVPGLLVFRSLSAQHLSDDEFVSAIWPAIKDANSHAEGFSQIGRRAIIPLPTDTQYPQTDKGTIIRAQLYRVFADRINEIYESLGGSQEGCLKLTDVKKLQDFLMSTLKGSLSINPETLDSDLFSSGLDSLKAIHFANEIRKKLYLGGRPEMVNQNSIYLNQNVRTLSKFLYDLQTATEIITANQEELDFMDLLIDNYSKFSEPVQLQVSDIQDQIVILTGVTGSLGSHVLARLLTLPQIKRIYCLVRRNLEQSPFERLVSSLQARDIKITSSVLLEKVECILTDWTKEGLGFSQAALSDIRTSCTTIIHAAWEVNFSLSLKSFTENIGHTKLLLDLALSCHNKCLARFVLCSSVSSALASPSSYTVPEALLSDKTCALRSGYARSKFIAEQITSSAAKLAHADVRVLRVGQLAGDTEHGIWNDSEAIPLMIYSATVIGALPSLDEMCNWLPVDQCASIIVELSGFQRLESAARSDLGGAGGGKEVFYNVRHPRPFHWTKDLLPTLAASGLPFEIVSIGEWIRRLESSEQDPETNPSIKLLDFWKEKYGSKTPSGQQDAKDDAFGEVGQPRFSMDQAMRDSACMRQLPDFLAGGNMERILNRWREKRSVGVGV